MYSSFTFSGANTFSAYRTSHQSGASFHQITETQRECPLLVESISHIANVNKSEATVLSLNIFEDDLQVLNCKQDRTNMWNVSIYNAQVDYSQSVEFLLQIP